jgi:hypothetical protein
VEAQLEKKNLAGQPSAKPTNGEKRFSKHNENKPEETRQTTQPAAMRDTQLHTRPNGVRLLA